MKSQPIFKISKNVIYSTGKRKTAIAKVWVNKGSGKITINNKSIEQYFSPENKDIDNTFNIFKIKALKPLEITHNTDKFDIRCSVKGGGFTGQIEAIRHGIAKCMKILDIEQTKVLREAKLLTRDSRKVERKKYGKKKARKSPQFSKR